MRLCHGAQQSLEFVWSRFVSENTSVHCERKVHGQTKRRRITPRHKKQCSMNPVLLKHSFRVPASWKWNKILKVSTLSFNAWRCTSDKRLSDSLENSGCRTNDPKSILYSLLLALEVIDFCSTNSRLEMSPDIKICGIWIRGTSRPCCWSTSHYPFARKHVVQELQNSKKKIWWSSIFLVGRPTSWNSSGTTLSRKTW
jgi:hypothetical protein